MLWNLRTGLNVVGRSQGKGMILSMHCMIHCSHALGIPGEFVVILSKLDVRKLCEPVLEASEKIRATVSVSFGELSPHQTLLLMPIEARVSMIMVIR